MKWKNRITKVDLSDRAADMKELYEDPKPRQMASKSGHYRVYEIESWMGH